MTGHEPHGAGLAGEPTALASAYEATSVPMCSLSWPGFEFVTANAAYRAFSGRYDLIGRNGRDLFPEFEGQQVFEMLERVCTTGVRQVLREWRIQLDTGSGVPVDHYLDLVVDPVPDAEGRTTRFQVIVIDVTEQARARGRAEAEIVVTGQRLAQAMGMVGALQSALLPDGLPVLPGLDLAASYRLADDDLAAGGDWFDVHPLEDGRVALVVGDVVGHGVDASATMGQLRSALGAALLAGLGPGEALAFLDRFAARVPHARATTAVVAVMDPATGEFCYCTAGHSPPLVVSPDGTGRYLETTGAAPLVSGSTFPEREDRMAPGETLVLFSDGLVERPGRLPAESLVEILQVASDAAAGRGPMTGAPVSAADRVAAWTVELLTRATGTSDDVTVLTAQRRSEQVRPLRVEVAAVPDAARAVRADLADWCAALSLDHATRLLLQHGVSELVTNSVEHAYPDSDDRPLGSVRLSVTVSTLGVLDVEVSDDGRWRPDTRAPWAPGAPEGARGRGLAMAHRLFDHLELERGDTGTTVRAQLRTARAVRLDTSSPPASAAGTWTEATVEATVEQTGERTVTVTGAVDLVTAVHLQAVLLRVTRGGTVDVTVDLSGVTLLGSAAVSVLLLPSLRGARLHAPPGSTAQQVLSLVGLDPDLGRDD